MKQLMFALAIVAALAASAEMKVGTVDLLLLVRNHPNYESNKALLSATDKDYQKKLEGIKSEGDKLQEEGRSIAEKLQNPMLAAKAKSDIEKQLMEIQKKLMGIEQRYRSEAMRCRQDLQDLEGRLLKATTDDLRKRIKTYATGEGYDLIVDLAAVPYAKDDLNVSSEILKAMGVNEKDVKKKDDESK